MAEYPDHEKRRLRLRDIALQSWLHYKTTGLHVTGEEVDRWLQQLEAGVAAALPVPHR